MTDDDTGGATEAQHDDNAFEESDTGDDPPVPTHEASTESTGNRVVEALQWAAFAILILLALVATFRFYFAASNAISNIVDPEFRSLFQAVFNLVILLASALGLSVLVRRIA